MELVTPSCSQGRYPGWDDSRASGEGTEDGFFMQWPQGCVGTQSGHSDRALAARAAGPRTSHQPPPRGLGVQPKSLDVPGKGGHRHVDRTRGAGRRRELDPKTHGALRAASAS